MMPAIFIGHGSPMNAIEDNSFTSVWREIAATLPIPSAILSISAHWLTKGTRVCTLQTPPIIHDFYGFPKALFDVDYEAKGSPAMALKTLDILKGIAVEDNSWGIDHGTWSILNVIYPNANIPVFQMSIDENASPEDLFSIGQHLHALRENNILILGSGNVVHNLGCLDFSIEKGFDWAEAFDHHISEKIMNRDFESVIRYKDLGHIAHYSVPTSEHFHPLIYILGASDDMDQITIYNNSCMAGSLSMTCYVFS